LYDKALLSHYLWSTAHRGNSCNCKCGQSYSVQTLKQRWKRTATHLCEYAGLLMTAFNVSSIVHMKCTYIVLNFGARAHFSFIDCMFYNASMFAEPCNENIIYCVCMCSRLLIVDKFQSEI